MNLSIRDIHVDTDQPVYFIADIAANHCGDLGLAKELIYACAEAGAHAAKFQNFTASSLVSDYGFNHLNIQADHQKKWKKSVFESYKDASIPLGWTPILQETAHKAGVEYMTSPYSLELLEKTLPFLDAVKIGSGDITFHEIILTAAQSSLPLIISTGASDMSEIELAMNVVHQIRKKHIVLMQCNTNYSATTLDDKTVIHDRFRNINLAVLATYYEYFPEVTLGLSDHTHGFLTVLGAVGLYDACVIEKHFTLDNSKDGQDHAFSMEPKSWSKMVKVVHELQTSICANMTFQERFQVTAGYAGDVEELEACLGNGRKNIQPNEMKTVVVQRRSLCAKSDLPEGHMLQDVDIQSLRPAPSDALPPYRISELIGKKLRRNILRGENIKLADVS